MNIITQLQPLDLVVGDGSTETSKVLANKAVAFAKKYDFTSAVETMLEAIALNPSSAYFSDLATFYRMLDLMHPAIENASKALSIEPTNINYLVKAAVLLAHNGFIKESNRMLLKAKLLSPEDSYVHYGLANNLLLEKQYAAGWREFEYRKKLPNMAGIECPPGSAWNGMKIEGRLLVYTDQGFGDIFQFARFLERASELCDGVIVALSSETLRPVFKQMSCVEDFYTQEHPIPYAAHCYLASLPYLLGVEYDSIPGKPYLHTDLRTAVSWESAIQEITNHEVGLFRVGINWVANREHPTHLYRSIPSSFLEPLLEIEGTKVFSLQKEIPPDGVPTKVVDLSARLTDWGETAAAIECMDVVISVDTSIAHLAGGIGTPSLILLSAAPEWRWTIDDRTTKWYPSSTLIRQPVHGDWQSVIKEAERLVKKMIPPIV